MVFSGRFQTVQENVSLIRVIDGLAKIIQKILDDFAQDHPDFFFF